MTRVKRGKKMIICIAMKPELLQNSTHLPNLNKKEFYATYSLNRSQD